MSPLRAEGASLGRASGLSVIAPISLIRYGLFRLTLNVVFTTAALGGVMRRIEFGSITLLGVWTIMTAVLASVFCLAALDWVKSTAFHVWPLILFAAWTCLSFLWGGVSSAGGQNVLVIVTFVGLLLATSGFARRTRLIQSRVSRRFILSLAIASGLYVVSLLLQGAGADALYGNRTFALLSLLGIAWHLARWRHGKVRSLIWAIALCALVALSLSRMALAIGLALFPIAQSLRVHWRRSLIVLASGGMALAILLLSLSYVTVLQERFLPSSSGDLASISLDAYSSGRAQLWITTLASAAESPWIGKGAGSADRLIDTVFGQGHPHNDYLRVLHDYGCIGLILLLMALAMLVRSCWRAWKAAGNDFRQASFALAALLSLLAVAMSMVTDNTVVYVFVMGPLGILVGTTIGLGQGSANDVHRVDGTPRPQVTTGE
jgi:O-antigen ligase